MNTPLLNARADAAALCGALPQPPITALGQAVNRGTLMLRYTDRWRFVHSAALLFLLGLALLLVGLIAHNDILSALGFIGLLAAGVVALRLDPAQLEALLTRVEMDCQRIETEHAAQCRQVAEEHTTSRCRTLQADAQAAIRAGTSIAELRVELAQIETGLADAQNDLVSRANQQRDAAQQRREDYKKDRAKLSAANRLWKARYFPGRSRQTVRAALAALQRVGEAECAAAQASACLKAIQEMAEALAAQGRDVGNASVSPATNGASLAARNDTPWWAGRALPPVEVLEAEGIQRARENITLIREGVLAATAQGEDARTAVERAVDDTLAKEVPGSATVEQYLATLNGDTGTFVGKVFADASPLCPGKSIPGHKSQRKVLALVCGSGGSLAFKALKERAPDSVGVFGHEHSPEELLLWFEERGVVLAELPEAVSCIETFRKLAPEQQRLLVTATENDEDITQFHPERPEDHGHPARLLASAIILRIATRSGSEQYSFNKKPISKGWRNAIESMRLDQRLAAEIEAKLEEAITNDGFAAVIAKLTEATAQPAAHVPNDFIEEFQAAVQEAIVDLHHRAATAAAVK